MMGSFGDVVTDRRLTRDQVDRHLAASTAEPALLLGDYVCLVSGGSSGLRGVFVQTTEEYAESSPPSTAGRWPRSWAAEGTRPTAW